MYSWAILSLLALWCLSGMIIHHFTFARETDYDPLGYLLSIFPGPFVLYYWKKF